jgi:hypothetical protein
MQLTGNTHTTLYELQGFNHGNMPQPAFPLLLKKVDEITKAVLAKQ